MDNLPTPKEQIALTSIDRYLNGEDATKIAEDHAITRQRLYQIMAETYPDKWAQAQASRALAEFDKTYREMGEAQDQLSLARARELHKSAQWVMERLLRKLYGETKPDTSGVAIQINVSRDGVQVNGGEIVGGGDGK